MASKQSGQVGRLPTFLIVGAMRSGTTSLARTLELHPQIFLPGQKELHYFEKYHDRGLDWYRSQFKGAGDAPAVGEATAGYMYDAEAMRRIAATLPDIRLMAIVRNPVDRAYSHYWHMVARRIEKRTFEEAIAAELANGKKNPRQPPYIGKGLFAEQLERICTLYPRERLHVVVFDDFRDAPGATYRAICEFLQVDGGFAPPNLGRNANPSQRIRSVRVRNLARKLPTPMRLAIARLNSAPMNYPPLSASTRAELTEVFRPSNRALAAWLGRDLSAWGT